MTGHNCRRTGCHYPADCRAAREELRSLRPRPPLTGDRRTGGAHRTRKYDPARKAKHRRRPDGDS